MTGPVIGAVSGVNEKVESFYRLCKARGLTGAQGVVLPRTNVPDLMLDPEVVAAVEDGRFHVHAVELVEQAIAIMTGQPVGEVLDAVAQELDRYSG